VQESQLIQHFDALARGHFAEYGVAIPPAELLDQPAESSLAAPALVVEFFRGGIPAGVARMTNRAQPPTEADIRDADKTLVTLVDRIAAELPSPPHRRVTRSWGGPATYQQIALGIWPWG
jgi:hypothetical protein